MLIRLYPLMFELKHFFDKKYLNVLQNKEYNFIIIHFKQLWYKFELSVFIKKSLYRAE